MLRRLAIPLVLSLTLGLLGPIGVATAAPPPHAGPKADRVDAPGMAKAEKVKAEKVKKDKDKDKDKNKEKDKDKGSRGRGPIDAPAEVGPYAVGRTTIQVADPDRDGRTLTVDVWYPSDPAQVVGAERSIFDLYVTTTPSPLAFAETQVSTAGGFPLVVFSHGSGGFRLQSWFLTELLASHGFVVAAPDHAGNTALDSLFGTTTPFEVTARNRPLDVSLVIDELLARNAAAGDRFAGAIDPERIGVIGHSFGGYTALAMASGWGDVAPDPRVKAIVPIAPATRLLTDEELASIHVPMLLLSGTSDTTTPIVPNTTRAWDLASSQVKYRVDIERAGHASFTDICDLADILLATGLPPALLAAVLSNADEACVPELLPVEQVQDLTNLYTVAFLERTLNDDGRYQRFLNSGYARSNDLPVSFDRRGGS